MAEIRGAEVTGETVGIRAGAFVVGTVGRLTPIKGIEYLLQAVSLLVREQTVPSIQVVIVGVGPSRTALEGLAQRLGIRACAIYGGTARCATPAGPL